MSSSVNDRLMEDITSIKNGGSINDEIGGRIIISSSVNDRLMEDITSMKMVVLSHGFQQMLT